MVGYAVALSSFRAHGCKRGIALARKGGAEMSEIATTENLHIRMASLEAGQLAMNTALGLMIDTLQMQTNLLQELAGLARDEPGPSPIMQSIEDLTTAVLDMGANVEIVGSMLAELPAKIGAVIDGPKSDPPS
jgi:hypothetical protein